LLPAARETSSLAARLLYVAAFALLVFLGGTGLALDRGFRVAVESGVRARLEAEVYLLLGAARIEAPYAPGLMPDVMAEPRLSTPGSGLYAQVVDDRGRVLWRSRSLLGESLPQGEPPGIGEWRHDFIDWGDSSTAFRTRLTVGIEAMAPGRALTFDVVEDRAFFSREVGGFRRSLWAWLAGTGLVLIGVQLLLMRWGLAPLRRLASEIARIEAGTADRLSADFPRELQGVTGNLNALLDGSRQMISRYRDALGDLAHSLKTPLAVLRATLDAGSPPEELRRTVAEQSERLQRTVDYQLKRAAASGRRNLLAPVPVAPTLARIVGSLEKVHADRSLRIDVVCPPTAGFPGDEGDLFELLGNLLDNACKWARSRVCVEVSETREGGRSGLRITVGDDGPGFPDDSIEPLLERGARADSLRPGQGIGLAVVLALLDAAGGRIEGGRSRLGGAEVRVTL
jgi:two-component system, OmpR family, sensor histidine kinase PhoQ